MKKRFLTFVSLADWAKLFTYDLVILLFLIIYAKAVCPFMDSLPLLNLSQDFLALYGLQFLFRLCFLTFVRLDSEGANLVRLNRLVFLNWFVAGCLSLGFFYFKYGAEFPIPSYFKLLSAYWMLGGLLVSRLEQLVYNDIYKKNSEGGSVRFLESIARTITFNAFSFSLVPFVSIAVILSRFVFYPEVTDYTSAVEALYVGGFLVTAASFVNWLYGKSLKEDSQAIVERLNKVKEGVFDLGVSLKRKDELGFISQTINEMALGLENREKIKQAFGKFVSPVIAEKFLENFGTGADGESSSRRSEKQDLTILMCDICDFTPLCEGNSPEYITKILNNYFAIMVEIIERHNGIIDKFIGDAIMAIFGITDELAETQSQDAYFAAKEMLNALDEFNYKNGTTINIGIGLERGDVVAGYIGSESRLEFTVIGHPVNTAARVESETRGDDIPNLLYTEKIARIIAKEGIKSVPAKKANLKGLSEPMVLYGSA